jgi:hypothetical protein
MCEDKTSQGIDRIAAQALIAANAICEHLPYLSPPGTMLVSEIADAAGGVTNIMTTKATVLEMVRAKGETRWNTQRPRPSNSRTPPSSRTR